MRRFLIALSSAILVASTFVGIAAGAPTEKNKHTEVISVNCQGLGTLQIVTMEHSANAFLPDGQVIVAKRFSGTSEFTVTTFDGVVFGPISDSFTEGVKGKGFEGRLVECSFTESFTESFTLDAGGAEFFGIPPQYVGTDVTLNGTFSGVASVIIPGK